MPESTQSFPQEIEVTFSLKIPVSSAEEKASWLNEDGKPSLDALADILDILTDNDMTVNSVNGMDYHAIQVALNERV